MTVYNLTSGDHSEDNCVTLKDWTFKTTFKATDLCIRDTLLHLRGNFEAQGLSAAIIGRLESVFAELFNNISKHAYGVETEGLIVVSLSCSPEKLIAEVKDKGSPMPGGILPDGALPDLNVDLADLPEGGFGWYIIKSQADDLNYVRADNENRTRLCFNLRQSERTRS